MSSSTNSIVGGGAGRSANIWQKSSNYRFPFTGKFKVTSDFGKRSVSELSTASHNHKGIDLAALENKTIYSVTSGIVKQIRYQKGYGNYVWTANDDGHACIYAHMKSVSCKVGQRLQAGTVLGIEGATGNVSGPHLHFGVSTNQDYSTTHTKASYWINPFAYLGVANYSGIKGKIFNGEEVLSGVNQTVKLNSDDYENSSFSNSGGGISNNNYLLPSGEYYEVTDIRGTLSDWLYGRRYRILVALDDGTAFDVSEVRCSFDIPKTQFKQANQAIVDIYNLNPNTENKIIQHGNRIVIEAGYNGNFYGKIYEGNIIQPVRSKENGVDYKLRLISMDSDRFLTYGLVGVTLVAGQSARDAVNAAVSKANYPIETGSIADTRINYPRGKVMFGKPSEYIDQIAKSMNATFYTEDGKVNIVQAKQTIPSDEIFELGPQTGLLGSPSQNELGIDFECLLNPLIGLNTFVRIDNKKIAGMEFRQGTPIRSLDSQGIYRVIKVKYQGDTRGSDWKCVCSAITQAGILPSFMSSQSLYIY